MKLILQCKHNLLISSENKDHIYVIKKEEGISSEELLRQILDTTDKNFTIDDLKIKIEYVYIS